MQLLAHIDRAGEIKKQLVDFANQKQYLRIFITEAQKQFGDPLVLDSEEELLDFQDEFIYTHKFPDGDTLLDKFIKQASGLSPEERNMVSKWRQPVLGIFEIVEVLPDGFRLENLLNEVIYTVRPNIYLPQLFQQARTGSFLIARIIPVQEEYTFSGVQRILGNDPDVVYPLVVEMQHKYPKMTFLDNKEKIQRGFELQLEQRKYFIRLFGSDEVLTPGCLLPERMEQFWSYFYAQKKDDQTGKSLAELARERGLDKIRKINYPQDLLEYSDVGIVFDEVEGLGYYKEYGSILKIFASFKPRLLQDERDLVTGYLQAKSISPRLLWRLSSKNPERAEVIFREVLSRPEFDLQKDFDSLMREFKPDQIGKKVLPKCIPLPEKLVQVLRRVREKENIFAASKGKVGRNEPCPCGSGKKYKRCCGLRMFLT